MIMSLKQKKIKFKPRIKLNYKIYMLWFNFILGLNFIFLCFKLIIIYYHTQKQRKIKFKPRTKLNHNIYTNREQIMLRMRVSYYSC